MLRVVGLALGMLLVTAANVSAQRQITGRVTDKSSGNPIGGSIVNLVGTLVSSTTSDDGRFRLTAPAGAAQLSVRRIGYKRQVVAAPDGQAEVNVSLEKDVLKLEEVVVTGTATTMERAHAATATQVISAEEVLRAPALDLTNALQGKVVGARINMNSGAPGGGGQIQIRGVTSLNGNGEPLYVVDGVLISNASIPSGANSITRASGTAPASTQDNMVNRLADVNPNDIESLEILKSAAASSMYGSRATNGVVLITTKRGRSGAPRFTLTQRVGDNSPMKLLGSRRFTTVQQLLDRGDGVAFVNAAGFSDGNIPYYDYQKDLFGHGSPSYETVVSMAAGTDNGSTRYYVSGSNKDDQGTMLNTKARRQSMRVSVDQLFTSKWSVSVGANILRTLASRGISNNDNTNTSPYYGFAYTPAVINLNAQDPATGTFVRNPFANGGSFSSNPFETMTFIDNNEDVFRQIGNANVTYEAWQNATHRVQMRALLGVDRFNQDDQVYAPNFLQFEPRDNLLGTSTQSNALARQMNGSLNAVWTFTPANRWFNATGSVGTGFENRYLNIYRIQGRGLLPGVPLSNQGTVALNHSITDVHDQFFFGQEEVLLLDDKLSFTTGMRAERSSANGERDKYFIYPKVAASYRFVDPVPYVNSFKVRASVGKTGNQPDYGRRDIVLGAGGLIDGRTSLAAPSTLGNDLIEPEKLTETEFGVDASFWNDRIGFEGTRFNRTIRDMFLFVPLAPSSGIGSQIDNAGTMETEGWEFGATVVPIHLRDFDWTSRATYYTFAGKITELPVPAFITSSGFGSAFGRARAYCPGFDAAGNPTLSTLGKCGGTGNFDPDGASGPLPARQVTIEPGSVTAIWGNRTVCDADDVVQKGCTLNTTFKDTIIGDATPDFEMTFGNDMRWKDFTFSTLIDWRKGGDVSNMTQTLFDEGANSWDYDKPSPNPAFNPSGATTPSLGQYRYDKWNQGLGAPIYIQDGSFVKLREITLSYAVPNRLTQKYLRGGRDMRLSLSGRNLKMWSDYWGVDPEVNNFGNANVARQVDLAPFPATKSWFFSVDVSY
jgi:TonB-dependent starch-binding outer membrane protein SusC